MNKLYITLLFLAGLLGFSGCSSDDSAPSEQADAKYVFVAYSVGSEGIESAPYIISSTSLTEGSVDLSTGIETDAYSFVVQNNTIFAAVYGGQGPVTPYKLAASGDIKQVGATVNTTTCAIYGTVGTNAWVGGGFTGSAEDPNATLFRFDAENLALGGMNSIDLTPLAIGDEWPTWYGVFPVDDDKLYIPYDVADADGLTQHRDNTWIMVVGYPDLKFQKVISDDRTGPIGSWFGMHGIKQVEDGDVYAYSSALASTNPSAFVRIKKGAQSFDQDYFFNIEEKTDGLKIARGEYIGNYKFLVSIYADESQFGEWSARTRMAIADVKNKTVTWIEGIPVHEQMSYKQKIFVESENKVHYVMKTDEGRFFVYNIDVAAATASAGLEFVDVADITTISKLTAEKTE
jgi:hypothetical protein